MKSLILCFFISFSTFAFAKIEKSQNTGKAPVARSVSEEAEKGKAPVARSVNKEAEKGKAPVARSVSEERLNPGEVLVVVEKGMFLDEVARMLKQKELIRNVFYFKLLARIKNAGQKIRSGEYVFEKDMGHLTILNILISGKVKLYPVVFPEGYNMYEMAELLDKRGFLNKEEFLSLCQSSDFIYTLLNENLDSLEGYLFPETYYVSRPVSPKRLIRKMVENFLNTYNQLKEEDKEVTLLSSSTKNINPLAKVFKVGGKREVEVDSAMQTKVKNINLKKQNFTKHQVVILASIVEKETGLAKERGLISGVFYNRLIRGMRLESDPTILYGMMREAGGLVPLNIRKKDILRKTSYNTYRISGLPAGPITNPGADSLKAVFQPEVSHFLYFVSRNDGSHVFSNTYEEHKKAVNFYQKKIREN